MEQFNTLELINYTPHKIVIYNEKEDFLVSFPSSGNIRLVSEERNYQGKIMGIIPVISPQKFIGLTIPQEIKSMKKDCGILVSMPVGQWISEHATLDLPNNIYVFGPDTSPENVVRSRNTGEIIGTKALIKYK